MIRRADDQIDFGFLNVHTNIYRIRQVMLGSQEATRLATSPIVAEIAKGETAVATRLDLQTFFNAARKTLVPEGKDFKGGLDFIQQIRGVQPQRLGVARGLGGGILVRSPAVGLGGAIGGFGGISRDATVIVRDTVKRDPVLEAKSPGVAAAFETISAVGLQVEKPLTLIDAVKAKATAGSILANVAAVPSAGHITQAPPIVGEAYDFRTTTVTDRLKQPPSLEAKSFSVAGKFEVLSGLKSMDIQLGDIPIKGVGGLTFANLTNDKLQAVLAGDHDPHPVNGDEADFLGAGIKALDDAVTTMRAVEGRIQQYRVAKDKAQTALDALRDAAGQIDRRLKVIGDELAEARHDVSVTRALLAEETARLQGINDRRDLVIAQHARFLVYMRPRLIEPTESAPTRVLNPGLTEAPVPVCLSQPVPVPPELRAMVDLLRESPVRWFTHIEPVMDRLDRLDVLHGALASAKVRANFTTAGAVANVVGISAGGVLGTALMKAFTAQQTQVAQRRLQTAELDLSAFAGQSWKHSRDQAVEILSLGDLIDGQHGQTDVSRQASLELEQITRVAACFYAHIDDVLPRIRLEWAERLSQYDDPVNLHNLGNLPRWGEIEFADRRELQALTDWLYQRVDPLQPEAIGLINDIVRVAILLASHAPVNQIVAGHVPKPTTVTPGSKIELSADLTKIRIGMHALVYDKEQVVARAVVRDLASGVAAAHIIETFKPNVSLEAGARVHFTAPENFAITAGAKRAVVGKR